MSKATDKVLRVVVGLVILAFAGYSQWVELHTDRNGWHEIGYGVVLVFGTLVLFPRLIIVVKQLVVIGAPLLPGGRRSYDPPAPPKDKP